MINKIIQNLLDSGLTQTEIAKRSNVPQSRISDIASGKQSTISYEAGKRLEALHNEILPNSSEQRKAVDRRASVRADRRNKAIN